MRNFRLLLLLIVALLPSGRALADACLADPVAISPNVVTSPFGKARNLPQYNGETKIHWGVDFRAKQGDGSAADLVAADSGTVVGAGFWGAGYGNRVALKRSNGDVLIYSHLSKVEPRLKSGAAIGFREQDSPALGSLQVSQGTKLGVAGGTANHMTENERAVHLHLEYVTGFGGTSLRETNDGTNTTRSRYMRNALDYMCAAPQNTDQNDGAPTGTPVPASAGQAEVARRTQPTVTDKERYGEPDAPPYETYAGLSESQMLEAEMLRRALDSEWEVNLTRMSKRGLWVEIARLEGVLAWLNQKVSEKRQRVEGMVAALAASRANDVVSPGVAKMQDALARANAAKRVR